MDFLGRNVLLRIVKPYPQAHNHIYTGRVSGYDGRFVCLEGCVFHFGKPSPEDPTGGLNTSPRARRWIPVERIQYFRELPEGVDPCSARAFRLTAEGNLETEASERPPLIPY